MFGQDQNGAGITARLAAAAETAERLELILVVPGRVRPAQGTDRRRWHLRLEDEHRLTVRAEWIVAATPGAQVRRAARH